MRVGWLCDNPGYVGGAELTQAEFRTAAPEGVKVIDCPAGGVVEGLDRYFIGNCVHYTMDDLTRIGDAPHAKYLNDVWPHGDAQVRQEILAAATIIFCSPLQRDKMVAGFERPIIPAFQPQVIPPAIDLKAFSPSRQVRRNQKREGACAIAQWRSPNKGAQRLSEWADENGLLYVYGPGEFYPIGPNVDYLGPLAPEKVPEALWRHTDFVHLPTALEPFGRCVVEAWAAGLDVTVNSLVGAKYWLEEAPEKLETAAEDFWAVVLDG